MNLYMADMLLEEARNIVNDYEKSQAHIVPHVEFDVLGTMTANVEKDPLVVPDSYKRKVLDYLHQLNLRLMDGTDNFYGYFYLQMQHDVRFDIASPAGIAFKKTKYVLYINPLQFFTLSHLQMESAIKHEILHIVSLHLLRVRDLDANYSQLAINLAMDVVVNTQLTSLPPDAVDLTWVNRQFRISLRPFKTLEYYVEEIQKAIHTKDGVDAAGASVAVAVHEEASEISTHLDPRRMHDIWMECDDVSEEMIETFTETYIDAATKGELTGYLANQVAIIKDRKDTLPWHYYLKKIVGTVTNAHRKTTTRRHRRQPERLDLRGTLRNHRAKIVVALDTSGSISNHEFMAAMEEVFQIVKNYNHEITIVECDNAIRHTYRVKDVKQLEERPAKRGGTAFSPVITYCNQQSIDLLIYFTDGEGETSLVTPPRGYRVLWVLTGRSKGLSLRTSYGLVKQLRLVPEIEDTVDFSDLRTSGYSMANQPRDADIM